jgi:seryl-tRNA synthetase
LQVIDLRVLREDPDRVRAGQLKRGESPELVDEILVADEQRRSAIVEFEELRGEQKRLGKQIPQATGEERESLLAKTKDLAAQVKKAEAGQNEAETHFRRLMSRLPNVADDAPPGGEDDYILMEEVGVRRDFDVEGFKPRDHVELGQILGAIDVERGAKVSGARFYYLTGVGAELELALVNMAMAQAISAGFKPMIPPALVKPPAMEGSGFLGQAAADVYHLTADDLYLVGTSEVPLAAYHSQEILDASTLPRRYAGFSPCYRREAGSYGKDTKGIFRVHWFDKVEMFSYTTVEESYAEHLRLLDWEKQWFAKLELPYRVIDIAAGDLGLSAVRKYDCEAWIPSQAKYRELTSTSNCTDFQTRRLDIRGRFEAGIKPIATLNGTLMASARTIVAIFENHQQADGSVRIPTALRPYLQGREVLEPVA